MADDMLVKDLPRDTAVTVVRKSIDLGATIGALDTRCRYGEDGHGVVPFQLRPVCRRWCVAACHVWSVNVLSLLCCEHCFESAQVELLRCVSCSQGDSCVLTSGVVPSPVSSWRDLLAVRVVCYECDAGRMASGALDTDIREPV